ncbi:hypothetical protein MPTK1_5g09370 [Marchantia polymorpha subsp. ruderalis]|uniref:Uncharacterized protein n=2 Tax=Marchantia polymorpha TaxID=3197 RepID=A0AAF6BGK3_MARPO|nr:hypothetical protein MARPO_0095s0023 [Marchantia polymorpha]BBN11137.1 hypothetical protein Mp_5g09370 [Marchantia polymorpha subsp. ruderalis]|eukprot:PTQ32761.1 hypothetical protein MARPO_0095s0023 [Marchantia polymorpha]
MTALCQIVIPTNNQCLFVCQTWLPATASKLMIFSAYRPRNKRWHRRQRSSRYDGHGLARFLRQSTLRLCIESSSQCVNVVMKWRKFLGNLFCLCANQLSSSFQLSVM